MALNPDFWPPTDYKKGPSCYQEGPFAFPYICPSDRQPDNPTVFGTDHEEFFSPITNYSPLEDFLQRLLPKEEFLERLRQWVSR